ncbi:hypothetical protein [Flaviaesturariibacter amylovorans]|uniref:hypothetical protein n=1 Tax=Flaviaesturariibacter amylovorans TaxID=1084520 RepID=UPI0031EDB028
MKVLGVIFSFYLLLLALEPGIRGVFGKLTGDATSCCVLSCEAVSNEVPQQEKCPTQNDCTSGACHPFEVCKNSVAVNSDLMMVSSAVSLKANLNFPFFKEHVPGEVYGEFWQPPKLS